jgi:hypothetical protein
LSEIDSLCLNYINSIVNLLYSWLNYFNHCCSCHRLICFTDSWYHSYHLLNNLNMFSNWSSSVGYYCSHCNILWCLFHWHSYFFCLLLCDDHCLIKNKNMFSNWLYDISDDMLCDFYCLVSLRYLWHDHYNIFMDYLLVL